MKIRILGHDHDLKIVKYLHREQDCFALYSNSSDAIHIDADISDTKKKTALLHEMIEAVNDHFELKIAHHKIQALEAGLFAIMADNPEIFQIKLPTMEESS